MGVVVPTRNPLWSSPYNDPDAAAYGETASALEREWRAANAVPGNGALVLKRTNVSQIVANERTGEQVDRLIVTTGWAADANITASLYSTDAPAGYANASSLQLAAASSSTTRGARKAYVKDLSVYGGGTLLRFWRRCTSVTNLTRWAIRYEFATVNDWAEFTVFASTDTINTWAEVLIAKGNPRATNGTVDWSNVKNRYLFVTTTGAAYAGNIQVRDDVIGLVQNDKTVPTGDLAWESSYDCRARYRDNATAKTTSTLAANSSASATNIKYTGGSYAVNDWITIETAGLVESRQITVVGTSGSGGTGLTVSEGFTYAHTSGDSIAVYYWGSWTPWLTVKVSQPPTVAANTPADASLVADPTLTLAHTFTSPAGKLQARHVARLYGRFGYALSVLAGAPAVYWRLNETAGTAAADSSPNAVPAGTYTAGFTLNQTGALSPADPDPAVLLNGSTGYVTVPTAAALHPGDTFTLEAWVKKAADGSAMTIIAAGTNDYCLRINAANQLELLKEGVGTAVLTSSVTITGTGWHHVACTKAAAVTTLYIDGVADAGASGTNATIVASAVAIAIGRKASSSAEFWNGTIDEVAVYGRALSAAEVAGHYTAQLEAPGDQLIRTMDTSDNVLNDTLPDFLLTDGQAYAWEKDAYDTDGLIGTTARRSFAAQFTRPASITNLAATQNAPAGSITLTWDASVDPYLDHYRVYWLDNSGVYQRIDGGPVVLDDGKTKLTAATFTHYGAGHGSNEYLVSQHNGALESSSSLVDVTLDAVNSLQGWSSAVTDGDSEHTTALRVYSAQWIPDLTIDTLRPPGRGVAVHRVFGRDGRHLQLTVRYRPVTDGDLATLFDDLASSGTAFWLKLAANFDFPPLRVIVIAAQQETQAAGHVLLTLTLDETATGRLY